MAIVRALVVTCVGIVALCVMALVAALPAAAGSSSFAPPAIDALDDPTGSLSIDDVSRGVASHDFHPMAHLTSAHTYVPTTRWYRFVMPDIQHEPLVLIASPLTDDAEMYYRQTDGLLGTVRFGMLVPFRSRPYPSVFPEVKLPANVAPGSTIYVRLFGPPRPLTVARLSDDLNAQIQYLEILCAFLGLIFAVGLSSLALAIYLREKAYALNAAAMAALILTFLTYSGLAYQLLWPTASVSFKYPNHFLALLYIFLMFLFARNFLWLESALPWIDRALWACTGAIFLGCVFILPSEPDVLNAMYWVLEDATWSLLLVAAVLRLRSGYTIAGYFVAAYAVLMIEDFVRLTGTGGPIVSAWGAPLAAGFDAIMFQFALADRVLRTNRERAELQAKNIRAHEELLNNERRSVERLEKYNTAFSHFVPRDFLMQLGCDDIASVRLGDHVEREMAILFADIRSFTTFSEAMSPQENFEFINSYLGRVGPIVREHGGFIDKYIGDAIMALFADDAVSAVDASIAVQSEVRRFNEARARALLGPIAIGIGLHWGKLMLGTIGEQERFDTTVISDAVNVASRLEGLTKTFGAAIVVSDAIVERLGATVSRYHLRPLGPVQVKGASRTTGVYELCDADPPELLLHKMATSELFETALHAYTTEDFERSRELFQTIVERNPRDLPATHFRECAGR
jgi:class 3 adenylate cyclase